MGSVGRSRACVCALVWCVGMGKGGEWRSCGGGAWGHCIGGSAGRSVGMAVWIDRSAGPPLDGSIDPFTCTNPLGTAPLT